MDKRRIVILDTPVDSLTMDETIQFIAEAIKSKKQIHHVVINAAKVVNMKKDRDLYQSVVNCDIINADGQAIVWASRILGKPLPERVAGVDLMENLVEFAHENKYKLYFFGATDEVVSNVAGIYSKKYSPGIIAGYRNGYYDEKDEEKIAENIGHSGADILFVGIPSPKKEIFLHKYKDIIKTPFIMGVGGSFDVISGKVRRSPLWMQKMGMEWFFRLIQEPRKMWKRYLVTNTLFIFYLVKEKFFNKKN